MVPKGADYCYWLLLVSVYHYGFLFTIMINQFLQFVVAVAIVYFFYFIYLL